MVALPVLLLLLISLLSLQAEPGAHGDKSKGRAIVCGTVKGEDGSGIAGVELSFIRISDRTSETVYTDIAGDYKVILLSFL